MKIICNKKSLINSINNVLKAISSKTTLPILKCILINATDELTLLGNDGSQAIQSKNTETNIIEQGSICVDAKLFSEIVKKAPEEEIIIETKENIVHIKSGNAKFKVTGLETEEYPDLPEIEKEKCITINSEEFSDLINKTSFAVAIDEVKPVFTGELIEIENNTINMVALDGYRVAHGKVSVNFNDSVKIVVPSKTLNDISKIVNGLNEDINIYLKDNNILVECSEAIILSRLIEGEFIDYKKIFSNECTTKIFIDVNSLYSSLDRVMTLMKEGSLTPVKFQIKDTYMNIEAHTESGEIIDQVDIEMDGNEMEISFNPKYIIDILKVVEEDKISFEFTTNLSPCIVKDDLNKFRYLALPLRPKN